MRVVEPNVVRGQKKTQHKKKSKRKLRLFILIFIAAAFLSLVFFKQKSTAPSDQSDLNSKTNPALSDATKPKKIKNFTGEEFRNLYNSFAYPNTQRISEETPITGQQENDIRIRTIARERGYVVRSAPVTNAFEEVSPNKVLQQRAAKDWKLLEQSANKEGIKFIVMDAYRSDEDQKAIFLSRLGPINSKALSDAKIKEVLVKTAPPGYSRHHTGYTIDLSCDGETDVKFEETKCFQWLSKDNYLNAKKHGWIPSYPEETETQGPEPESWEYVWVGVEALYE